MGTSILEKLRDAGKIESQTPVWPTSEFCNFEKTDDSDIQEEATAEEKLDISLTLSEPLLHPKFVPTKNTKEEVVTPAFSRFVQDDEYK